MGLRGPGHTGLIMEFSYTRLVDRLAAELRVIVDFNDEINLTEEAFIEMVNTLAAENLYASRSRKWLSLEHKLAPSALIFRAAILARIHEMRRDVDDPLRPRY